MLDLPLDDQATSRSAAALPEPKEPWPLVNYVEEFALRQRRLRRMRADLKRGKITIEGVNEYYKNNPIEWIEHWGVTYDPRNVTLGLPAYLPFILFKRQRELVDFFEGCLQAGEGGLVEKSRDMGVTWAAAAYAAHKWKHFDGLSIGFGSYQSDKVDKIGDPDSILEKVRLYLRWLPEELLPAGFSVDANTSFMRIINPENGATIVGGVGDNIGRGGRKTFVFTDEDAHYEHPEAVEAALMANTPVRICMSSVFGLGTLFERKRESGVDYDPKKGIVKGRVNVFVFDWRDHPGKTQEWYDTERAKHEAQGTLHVLAQEIDRDYAASVEGVIIPPAHVKAAIDAHKVLGIREDGGWCGGLDIADQGGDTNTQATRRGVILKYIDEWGAPDVGESARRAIANCRTYVHSEAMELHYDAVGVGAGVKAEANRLIKDGLMPRTIQLFPWMASWRVLNPKKYIIENDKKSPTNEVFFENLKAQAAWDLKLRFERTYKAITDPNFHCNENELISLDSQSLGPLLRKLEKELSQPTIGRSTKLKLMVNKKPDGSKSPNLFDAVMMAYFPAKAPQAPVVTPQMLVQIRSTMGRPRRPKTF